MLGIVRSFVPLNRPHLTLKLTCGQRLSVSGCALVPDRVLLHSPLQSAPPPAAQSALAGPEPHLSGVHRGGRTKANLAFPGKNACSIERSTYFGVRAGPG